MNNIVILSKENRSTLFVETANRMGINVSIVEKDFWVVWVLYKIFSNKKLKDILVFKGGTSLSKVYHLIGRFSEDIDLILSHKFTDKDINKKHTSNTKQVKFNSMINKEGAEYIKDKIYPILSEILYPYCECKIDKKDPLKIHIKYPSSFKDDYLLPYVLLEIGPLALLEPSEDKKINSFASIKFPKLFNVKDCFVKTVIAERTFWEKATILHAEANREGKLPLRYSRHYYDLAMMTKSKIKKQALLRLDLLESVIEFKNKFYYSKGASYETAKPGTFKLLPSEIKYNDLKKDYKSMQNMIYSKELSFDEIINTLKDLVVEINNLS